MKKIKAVVLFSGGLDSILTIKLLQEQKIDVRGYHFLNPFSDIKNKNYIEDMARQLKIKLFVEKPGKDYLKIIRKPKYGYGKNLNPCIDCRIFILKKAKQYAKKIKADFIATGEVLNERPMSQNRKSLVIVEKESKIEILRPLSAKLLPETKAEKKGLVDRNKLLSIIGRNRKKQLELAKKYKIKNFLTPAGGCLLTNSDFSKKLKDLFEHNKNITFDDIELLKIGRHFRFNKTKIIVGRNEKENNILEKHKGIKITAGDKSPTTIIIGRPDKKTKEIAAMLTVRYSDYGQAKIFEKIVRPIDKKLLEKLRV